MFKTKQVAAAIGAAFALGYGATASAALTSVPAALADAMLKFSNFSFTSGGSALCQFDPTTTDGGALGICRTTDGNPLTFDASGNQTSLNAPTMLITNGTEIATAKGTLGSYAPANSIYGEYNLSSPTTSLGGTLSEYGCVDLSAGNNSASGCGSASAVLGAAHTGVSVTDTFTAGTSTSTGNSLTGTASVLIQSTVSLAAGQTGGEDNSTQNLVTDFDLLYLGGIDASGNPIDGTIDIDLDFSLQRFLRAALSVAEDDAFAKTTFQVKIQDHNLATGNLEDLVIWDPGASVAVDDLGGVFVGLSCNQTSGFLAVSTSRNVTSGPGDSESNRTGDFNLSCTLPNNPIQGHAYKFTIEGTTQSYAHLLYVPEPGVISLLGLGLLGLGVGLRKKGVQPD